MPTAPHSLLTLIKEMPIAVHLVDPPADTSAGGYRAAAGAGEKSRDIEAMHRDAIIMIMSIRFMVLEHTR